MLHFDDFFDLTPDEQEDEIFSFHEQHGETVGRVADIRMYELWSQLELQQILMKSVPREWTNAECQRHFYIHRKYWEDYRTGTTLPGPETIHTWLRRFRLTYPSIKYLQVYDAISASTAVQRVIWETEVEELVQHPEIKKQDVRSWIRRRDLREVQLYDAILVYALAAPGDLHEAFISLLRSNRSDHCIDDLKDSVVRFLADLLAQISHMFGVLSDHDMFALTVQEFADIDLDSKREICELVRNIERVWNTSAVLTHKTARCLDYSQNNGS